MIPNRPAPRLSNEGRWSKDFVDFVSKCLVKDPNQRATAKQLLEVMMLRSSHAQHPFVSKTIQQLKSGTADWEVMQTMIHRLRDVKARFLTTEREKKKAENAARPRVAPQPVPKPSVHAVKPPVVKPPVSVPEEEDNTGTMIMRASTAGSENHSVTSHSLHRAPSESSHPTHAPREPNTAPSQQPPGVIMLNSQAAVLKSKPRSNLSPPVLQSPVLQPAFANVVPALFGAMAYQYFRKNIRVAIAPLVMMSVLFMLVPSLTGSTSFMIVPSGALAIGIAYALYRKQNQEDKA